MFEAAGTIKHASHALHLADIPLPNVLVEAAGTLRHAAHVLHLPDILFGNVLVEVAFATSAEHLTHVGHLIHDPVADMPALLLS